MEEEKWMYGGRPWSGQGHGTRLVTTVSQDLVLALTDSQVEAIFTCDLHVSWRLLLVETAINHTKRELFTRWTVSLLMSGWWMNSASFTLGNSHHAPQTLGLFEASLVTDKGVLSPLSYCLLLNISTRALVLSVSQNRPVVSNKKEKQLQSLSRELPSSLTGNRWHTTEKKNKREAMDYSYSDSRGENIESFSFILKSQFVRCTPKQQVE